MYYISHILLGPEKRYTKVEIFTLVIVISTTCLRPYFEAHPLVVLTDLLLQNILHKLDALGWTIKYAIELSTYGL